MLFCKPSCLLPATLLLCLSAVACSSQPTVPQIPQNATSQNASEEIIPVGNLMDDRIAFEFAIYYLPKPSKDPSGELDSLLRDRFTAFHRVDQLDDNTAGILLAARAERDPRARYTPPAV